MDAESASVSPSSPWRKPLLLAGIGLALMIVGYKAMDYVPSQPPTPRQAEQEKRHADLRKMAAQHEEQHSLAERLDQIAPPWRDPPYRIPGRLALYFGLFLFLTAGVLMYRHSPPSDDDASKPEA